MNLTILGSGTGLPTKNRNAPGYLLEINNKLIMLDAGEGTKRQIVKAGYNLFKLSHIFITHTHVDHTAELPAILWPFIWAIKKKTTLTIVGPPKFKQFFSKITEAYLPTLKSIKHLKIIIKEVKNNNLKLNNLSIKTRLMSGIKQINTYSPYAVGYKIYSKDKSLVFCGDNDFKDKSDILNLAKNCDLLILESAAFKPSFGHLTPKQAGKIAAEAKVKKLILTHLYPVTEKLLNIKKIASKYYKGPIILAKDLMKIKI